MLSSLFGLKSKSAQAIDQIDARTLKQRLESGEKLHVIDVRSSEEFALGHIQGARLLPLFTLMARVDELPDDRPIVVTCRSGARSQAACEQLSRAGFSNVINLSGGVIAWQRSGLSLVNHH